MTLNFLEILREIGINKGNTILGMIRRNITYKENGLIVPLYKAIIRPHLECGIQAWGPYRRKNIDMLEKIRRRATNLIPGLRDFSYIRRHIEGTRSNNTGDAKIEEGSKYKFFAH